MIAFVADPARPKSSHLAIACVLPLLIIFSGCVGPLVPVVRLDPDSQMRLSSQVKVYKVAEQIDGRITSIGSITATSCKNQPLDPTPTEEDATAQLRYRAIQAGGNAVLNVVCESEGTSLIKNCWTSVTCRGTAARIENSAGAANPSANTEVRRKSDNSGKGFFVNRDGFLVTNQNVVDGCKTIRVKSQKLEGMANLVAMDESNDLAVLRIESDIRVSFISIRPSSPKLAEPVAALGYPLPGVLSPSVGASTGTVSSLAGMRGDSRFIQISAPVQPGNSGGPLIDANGALVGVIVGKLNALKVARVTGDIPQNVNFAIGLRSVQTFLEARGIAFSVSEGSARDLPTAVDNVSIATVQVLCFGGD